MKELVIKGQGKTGYLFGFQAVIRSKADREGGDVGSKTRLKSSGMKNVPFVEKFHIMKVGRICSATISLMMFKPVCGS